MKKHYFILLAISAISIILGISFAGRPTSAEEERSSLYREGLQHLYPYYVPGDQGGATLSDAYAAPVDGNDAAERSYNFARQRLGLNELGGVVFGTSLYSVSRLDPLLEEDGQCGIAAWDCGGERWQSLLAFSRIYNLDYLDLQSQLLFINFELNGLSGAEGAKGAYQDVYDNLRSADSFLLSLGFFMQNYLNQTPYDLTSTANLLYGYEVDVNHNDPEPEPEPEPVAPEPEPVPPQPEPIAKPDDNACSAGLSSGYIATSNAADQDGAYLVSLEIRRLDSNSGRTTTLAHRCLKDSLEQLLADHNSQASADNKLGGWVWRSNQRQIELRQKHCGSSHYDIYEKPANSCDPPTARPGYSSNQDGLAIDFYCKNTIILKNNCGDAYHWLDCNAARYGLVSLPTEPWHWYYPLDENYRLEQKISSGC